MGVNIIYDLQQEQIKEMQEHQEAMRVADETIKALEKQISILEIAGQMAVDEIDVAKDMLSDCHADDWAYTLNTSWDYFKAKAREEINNEN